MSHTNSEFARAVFEAESVEEAKITIEYLINEIDSTTEWLRDLE